MVFYDVAVTKAWKGKTPGPDVIVATLDTARVTTAYVSALSTGADVVLFLERRPEGASPGITSIKGDFYVLVGGDNGILDVHGGTVTARAAALNGLREGKVDVPSGQRLTVPLAVIETAASAT